MSWEFPVPEAEQAALARSIASLRQTEAMFAARTICVDEHDPAAIPPKRPHSGRAIQAAWWNPITKRWILAAETHTRAYAVNLPRAFTGTLGHLIRDTMFDDVEHPSSLFIPSPDHDRIQVVPLHPVTPTDLSDLEDTNLGVIVDESRLFALRNTTGQLQAAHLNSMADTIPGSAATSWQPLTPNQCRALTTANLSLRRALLRVASGPHQTPLSPNTTLRHRNWLAWIDPTHPDVLHAGTIPSELSQCVIHQFTNLPSTLSADWSMSERVLPDSKATIANLHNPFARRSYRAQPLTMSPSFPVQFADLGAPTVVDPRYATVMATDHLDLILLGRKSCFARWRDQSGSTIWEEIAFPAIATTPAFQTPGRIRAQVPTPVAAVDLETLVRTSVAHDLEL